MPKWGNDLYIFKAGSYCKIGRSFDVERRAREVSASCPFPVEVVAVFPGRGGQEGVLHKQFAEQRMHGEWFHCCPAAIVSAAAGLVCTQEVHEQDIVRG